MFIRVLYFYDTYQKCTWCSKRWYQVGIRGSFHCSLSTESRYLDNIYIRPNVIGAPSHCSSPSTGESGTNIVGGSSVPGGPSSPSLFSSFCSLVRESFSSFIKSFILDIVPSSFAFFPSQFLHMFCTLRECSGCEFIVSQGVVHSSAS
jgi:hypothetical protein